MATVVFPEINNNGFTQLDGAITDSATTINVDSTAAIGLSDSTTDAYVTIVEPTTFGKDPTVDPETFEIVQITAISTNQWTVTRGVDGTSGIAFSDNAYVFQRVNAAVIQRLMDALTDGTDSISVDALEVSADITPDVLRAADIGTAALPFADIRGEKLYVFPSNAGAQPTRFHHFAGEVSGTTASNELDVYVVNGSAVSQLVARWTGDKKLIALGDLEVRGSLGSPAQTSTGTIGTTTIDWSLGNNYHFTFGATNDTFTFTDPAMPATIIMSLLQDSVGTRLATWPAAVKWAGGTPPTLTTTATTGLDIIEFYFDGTSYHGRVVVADSQ